MKIRIAVSFLLATIGVIVIFFLSPDLGKIPDFYSQNIRASLFTGLLTAGSFLLSLKAFIVVKLKENVFDSASYKRRLAELRKLNPSLSHYGPVLRLSHLMFYSIASAILASVSQLTIGLLPYWQASLLCVFFAIFAVSMLVGTLLLIREIIDQWLGYLEKDGADSRV